MAVNEKTYVEKAIQTLQVEKLMPLPNPSLYRAQDLVPNRGNEETSTGNHTDVESAPVGPAYNYSESLCSSQSLDSGSSIQSKPHRVPKPAQLPRNRPNRIQNQVKRVVSLPESAELKSSSDNLRIPADDGLSHRVVSLPGPELRNNLSTRSPGSTQDDLSSTVEYLDSSLDTSYQSGTGSMHPDARGFPSDMPMTPSPPSSPESVFVIGNESRVSKAFLRQCNMSSSKTCDAEDEAVQNQDVLLTSFSYRGAEGTIIEDADLPRMIWGLDLEDGQSNAGCEAPSAKSPQLDTAIVGSQVSGPPNQVARNPHQHSHDIRPDLKDKTVRGQPQPFAPVPEFRPQQIRGARAWSDAPIDIHKLTPYNPCIDALQLKRMPESNFVPSAPPCQRSSPCMTPRIFVEPRPGSQITPGPRLSAIEIAQRYRAERQQTLHYLSPTNSPTAPPSHEHELASNFNQSNFCRSNLPANRELQNIVNLPNANYTDPRMHTSAAPQDSFARPDMRVPPPTARAGSRSLALDSPTLLQQQQQQPNVARTRLLQGHRIQSIPMTRLIQRRLSSVAEELEDSSSPCTHLQADSSDVKAKASIVVETAEPVDHCKENATDSIKGTIKKKWRSRKKVVARSLNLNK
ncbi:hypothetical protein C0992_004162 [Termitomyces sp. T32_za158]|nr:hypothetical protein C0992_004162 [Termitomyces sp. T32_za158]